MASSVLNALEFTPEWIIGGEFTRQGDYTLYKYLLEAPHYTINNTVRLRFHTVRVGALLDHLRQCAEKVRLVYIAIFEQGENEKALDSFKKLVPILQEERQLRTPSTFSESLLDRRDTLIQKLEEHVKNHLPEETDLLKEIETYPTGGKKTGDPVRDLVLAREIDSNPRPALAEPEFDKTLLLSLKILKLPSSERTIRMKRIARCFYPEGPLTAKLLKTHGSEWVKTFNENLEKWDQAHPFETIEKCDRRIDEMRQNMEMDSLKTSTVLALIDERPLRPNSITWIDRVGLIEMTRAIGSYAALHMDYRKEGLENYREPKAHQN